MHSCHSCIRYSASPCSISIIEIFLKVAEDWSENGFKNKSEEIISKSRQAMLSFLHVTLHIHLFYNPFRYHYIILNGYLVTCQERIKYIYQGR